MVSLDSPYVVFTLMFNSNIGPISRTGAELGHMSLTLVGNNLWRVQWHGHICPLTLKGQSQGYPDFQ